MLLTIVFALLLTESLAYAEIKVIPPLNWQPSPSNNSTSVAWFQNSTKSAFVIIKGQDSNITLPLAFMAPVVAQFLADSGALESADQLSFGHSNYGFRYFLNLSALPAMKEDAMFVMLNSLGFGNYASVDVPMKLMIILTEKHKDLYGILLTSPRDNFDSVLSDIKPTIDSIQLSSDIQVFRESLNSLVSKSQELTKKYQDEVGRWNTKINDNLTMVTITDRYLTQFDALENDVKNLKVPNEYENIKDSFIKSLESEVASYQHFKNYLVTGNRSEDQLSNDNLSLAYQYEKIYSDFLSKNH